MKKIFFLCLAVCLYVTASAQTDTTLQQYTGKYKFPDGSVISEAQITLEGGSLSVTSSAGVSPLEKQGEDLFAITQFQGTAKFKRDANKKVVGVSISAMGYELEGTKVEGTAALIQFQKRNALTWAVVAR